MRKKGNPNKKPKKGLSKSRSQFLHAQKRAEERYQLQLTSEVKDDIVSQIQYGLAPKLENQSNRIATYAVTMSNSSVPVVYDNMRKSIVSFLPESYFSDVGYGELSSRGTATDSKSDGTERSRGRDPSSPPSSNTDGMQTSNQRKDSICLKKEH